VFRKLQAVLPRRLVYAHRLQVAGREDCGGPVAQAEQLQRGGERGLVVEVAGLDQPRIEVDPRALQRGPVTVQPGLAARYGRAAGNRGDPAMTELDQVLGRGQAAGPVSGADGQHLRVGPTDRVHDDHRYLQRGQPVAVRRRQLGEDQDHPVGAAGSQALEPVVDIPVLTDRRDGDPALGRERDRARAADDLHGPRAELGAQEIDDPGGLGLAPVAARVS